MNAERQVEVVRQFMLAIAPELARHELALIRRHVIHQPMDDDGLATLYNQAPNTVARRTLQWSLHLAANYAATHDQAVYSPPGQNSPPPVQQQKSSPAAGLQQDQEGVGH